MRREPLTPPTCPLHRYPATPAAPDVTSPCNSSPAKRTELAALYLRRVINSASPPGPLPPRGDSAQAITDGGRCILHTDLNLVVFIFFFLKLPLLPPSLAHHPPTPSLFSLADIEVLLYAPLYLAVPRSATASSLRLREETQPDASFVFRRALRRTRREAASFFFFPKPVLRKAS